MTGFHRVLVVEDHAAFRGIVCELLQESPSVRIVGEAADGLEAVHQAATLRPDVVVLDMNLPSLNGFEVARRIRAAVPHAKVLFLTVETSLEVVEQAFRSGAHGYVYKPRAQRDMLAALDAITHGARFVNGGLERVADGDSLASHHHRAAFCSSDEALIDAFGRFIACRLDNGGAVISLVTDAHAEGLRRNLLASPVDFDSAIREQRYMPLRISDLLAQIMVDGYPDPVRFSSVAEQVLTDAFRRAKNGRVAACGECAPTLWAQGHREAAIQLEHLWDEAAKDRPIDVLCVYPLSARVEKMGTLRRLCAEHTSVDIS